MGVSINGLTAATTLAEADEFEIEQSGVSKKITKAQLRQLLLNDPAFSFAIPQEGDVPVYDGSDFSAGALPRWRVINQAAYTEASPSSSSTITFDGGSMTNGIKLKASDYFAVGSPVRTEIGTDTFYYGICTAVTDSLITIAGAPLALSPILSLAVGTPEMVRQIPIYVGKAAYAQVVADLTAGKLRWWGRTGYLVAFSGAHETTGQPKINVKCNGNLVSTNDSNNGIQLSATPGTFVDNPAVEIDPANYVIAHGQDVVIRVTALVGSQSYLSMSLVFVVP